MSGESSGGTEGVSLEEEIDTIMENRYVDTETKRGLLKRLLRRVDPKRKKMVIHEHRQEEEANCDSGECTEEKITVAKKTYIRDAPLKELEAEARKIASKQGQTYQTPYKKMEREYQQLSRGLDHESREALLRQALNFRNLEGNTYENREKIVCIREPLEADSEHRQNNLTQNQLCAANGIYRVAGTEGVYILPGVLSTSEQEYFIRKALRSYIEPPNRRNIDANAEEQNITQYEPPSNIWSEHVKQKWSEDGSKQESYLERIAWATLGFQYDWTNRRYNTDPQAFRQYPKDIWMLGRMAAELVGESIVPEAGIVNYYRPKACMGGHQDNSELTYDHPVVGFSFGCTGVFLLGGCTKEETPIPLLLQSGDCLIMGGSRRLAVHGVPAHIPNTCPSSLFTSQPEKDEPDTECSSLHNDIGVSPARTSCQTAMELQGGPPLLDKRGWPASHPEIRKEEEIFRQWIQQCRLNINVRQIFPDPP